MSRASSPGLACVSRNWAKSGWRSVRTFSDRGPTAPIAATSSTAIAAIRIGERACALHRHRRGRLPTCTTSKSTRGLCCGRTAARASWLARPRPYTPRRSGRSRASTSTSCAGPRSAARAAAFASAGAGARTPTTPRGVSIGGAAANTSDHGVGVGSSGCLVSSTPTTWPLASPLSPWPTALGLSLVHANPASAVEMNSARRARMAPRSMLRRSGIGVSHGTKLSRGRPRRRTRGQGSRRSVPNRDARRELDLSQFSANSTA